MAWIRNITNLKDLEYFEEHDEWLDLDYCVTKCNKGYDDPLEHLPKFENQASYLHNRDYYDRYYHYYKINPYKLAERIIIKNIGKSHDISYSYYLKQFPSNYKRYDIDYAWNDNFKHRRYRRYLPEFYIDNEGLIQVNKSTKIKRNLTLHDYKNDTTWEYYGKDYRYHRDKAEFEDFRRKSKREWKIYNLQIKLEKYQKYFKERKLKDKELNDLHNTNTKHTTI